MYVEVCICKYVCVCCCVVYVCMCFGVFSVCYSVLYSFLICTHTHTQLFSVVEKQHGNLFVRRMLGLITAARRGLSDIELIEIVNADYDFLSVTCPVSLAFCLFFFFKKRKKLVRTIYCVERSMTKQPASEYYDFLYLSPSLSPSPFAVFFFFFFFFVVVVCFFLFFFFTLLLLLYIFFPPAITSHLPPKPISRTPGRSRCFCGHPCCAISTVSLSARARSASLGGIIASTAEKPRCATWAVARASRCARC